MTEKTVHTCPDIELLSAWMDGEHIADEAFMMHIANCSECRKKIDAYRNIGVILTQALSAESSDKLETKILLHIRAEEKNRKERGAFSPDCHTRLPWIIRIAALVLLAAFFIFLVIDRSKVQMERKQVPVTTTAGTGMMKQNESLQPSYPVIGVPKNNLIRTVSTASDGYPARTALDINPLLLPVSFPIPTSLELNPPESPECVLRKIDLSDDITAGELYPQLRNALASLEVPNVSFAVRRQNDLVTALVEIRSANRLSLIRHNNMLEFRITEQPADFSKQTTKVRYELQFFCKPAR